MRQRRREKRQHPPHPFAVGTLIRRLPRANLSDRISQPSRASPAPVHISSNPIPRRTFRASCGSYDAAKVIARFDPVRSKVDAAQPAPPAEPRRSAMAIHIRVVTPITTEGFRSADDAAGLESEGVKVDFLNIA